MEFSFIFEHHILLERKQKDGNYKNQTSLNPLMVKTQFVHKNVKSAQVEYVSDCIDSNIAQECFGNEPVVTKGPVPVKNKGKTCASKI
jgi:hypothetical protein